MNDHARPLVTIGIPTYNRAETFLPISLGSALAQDYEPLEIIVSDNCSTDSTAEIVQSMSDSRVRYLQQPTNLGPLPNYQRCLDAASGSYFMLLQDDDQIDPDFVSTCMAAVDGRSDIGYIRTGTRVIDASGTVLAEHENRGQDHQHEEALRAWFDGRSAYFFCSTLFNTEDLRDAGGFTGPTALAVDWLLYVQVGLDTTGVNVPDVKASFRKHGGELTFTSGIQTWTKDTRIVLDVLEEKTGAQQEGLRRDAAKFFFPMVYRYAEHIASPVERVGAYWSIFRASEYMCPPPRLANAVKQLLPRAAVAKLRKAW
mgnify:CR=1 FL=1